MLKEITVDEFLGLKNLEKLGETLPRTPYDRAEWLKRDNFNTCSFQLIDVREPYEYEEGNIKNSINIPMGDILDSLDKLDKSKKLIILYCRTGRRSASVGYMLGKLHKLSVYSLKEGYEKYLKVVD
jgi:rhodanese-related sulfurtransferase